LTLSGVLQAVDVKKVETKDAGGSREVQIRPRIYLNGFPKSGLHLAVLMGRVLAHEPACDYPWAGSFKLNGWSSHWLTDYQIYPNLSRLQDNTWLKGHCGYKSEIEQYLYRHGVSKVFVYRDLRDVLVSQAYHVLAEDEETFKHPDHAMFRQMDTFEDVLMACLTGVGPFSGLFERWELYAPWLWINWVFAVRFEDMIEEPKQTARSFIRYAYDRMSHVHGARVQIPDKVMDNATVLMLGAMKVKENSLTFRKGKIGEWKKEFTPKVTEEFKRRGGRWLIELGYEEDDNW
jgi:hypothetical protein